MRRCSKKKLDEETAEFHSSNDVEELADILEVLFAIGKTKGVSPEQLDNIRVEKRKNEENSMNVSSLNPFFNNTILTKLALSSLGLSLI